MRTGLAKQFKQVLDSQVKRGKEAGDRLPDEAERRERNEPRPKPARRQP
jgi:hypothetical protein